MLAKPSSRPPATIQNQGALLGEIISDLVSDGMPITEILTEILSFGPISLREAVHVARSINPVSTTRRVRGPGSWHLSSTCAVCSGPAHDYYPSGPPEPPSGF